jgi:hypothetical protein
LATVHGVGILARPSAREPGGGRIGAGDNRLRSCSPMLTDDACNLHMEPFPRLNEIAASGARLLFSAIGRDDRLPFRAFTWERRSRWGCSASRGPARRNHVFAKR